MSDPQGLDLNNVTVTTRVEANPKTGAAQRVHVVSYMLGTHGPFVEEYPPGTYTAQAVKANIDKQQATLREFVPLQTS